MGYLERGSCLLASPPGVGAPLLELYASAARPRGRTTARPRPMQAGRSCLQRIRSMSLSASRRGHHTTRQCAPLDAIALVCLMLRTRLAAAERRLQSLAV